MTRTLTSKDAQQTVEIITATRPAAAVLDPDNILLDLDPSNNRKAIAQ